MESWIGKQMIPGCSLPEEKLFIYPWMCKTLLCARPNLPGIGHSSGQDRSISALLESRIARRVWGAENKQVKQQAGSYLQVLINTLKKTGYERGWLTRLMEGSGERIPSRRKWRERKKDSAARGRWGRKGMRVAGVEVGEERVCVCECVMGVGNADSTRSHGPCVRM